MDGMLGLQERMKIVSNVLTVKTLLLGWVRKEKNNAAFSDNSIDFKVCCLSLPTLRRSQLQI